MNWLSEGFAFLWSFVRIYWLNIITCSMIVILTVILLRLLRMVVGRLLLIAQLKKVAKKNRLQCSISRSLLTSLFYRSAHPDIKLKTSQESYHLFFCPGDMRKKNVYVFDDTKLYYTKVRANSLFGNRNWGGAPALVSVEETRKKELSFVLTQVEHTHNVLIFVSGPIDFFVYRGNGYAKSGSGDQVGNLLIYESKDFLNFMIRNYAGRA